MKKITNPKHQITNNLQIPITNKFSVIRVLVLCIVCNLGFVYWNLGPANAGSVQFSTYYPAPFGMYDRLRLVPRTALTPPCDPGTLYINSDAGNQLEVCSAAGDAWAPLSGGPWTEAAGNIYAINTAASVGIGTTAPRTRLELDNDGAILATGTYGSGWTEPNLGAGVRLLWYPRKAAFRVGSVDGSGWDDGNIGNYSIAFGHNTTASGGDSMAWGQNSVASGGESLSFGKSSRATASNAVSLGLSTTASGNSSTAMGYSITAQSYVSTVLGQFNVISGNTTSWVTTDPLFVIGNGTSAASPSNAVTVLKNGNVGIGTTTPNNKLQVTGLVNFDNTRFSTSLGYQAGNVDAGTSNTFVGYQSGRDNTTGTANTFLGTFSGIRNTGTDNTFIGNASGNANTTGTLNTFLGQSSGITNTTGTSNILIGYNINAPTATTSYFLNIGNAIYGNLTTGNVGIGTTDPGTNKLEVAGGPIKATGGLIIPTCTIAAGDCPAAPVPGQLWLCTDC